MKIYYDGQQGKEIGAGCLLSILLHRFTFNNSTLIHFSDLIQRLTDHENITLQND